MREAMDWLRETPGSGVPERAGVLQQVWTVCGDMDIDGRRLRTKSPQRGEIAGEVMIFVDSTTEVL